MRGRAPERGKVSMPGRRAEPDGRESSSTIAASTRSTRLPKGYETIMVNCNPETVSTDYDTSDRLYFEPLTAEDVIEICRTEQSAGRLKGVIVQYGGQTPLKLAHALADAGVPILGTSPDAIDLAEDRDRFQRLLHEIGLRQPNNGTATSMEQAVAVARKIGYPVLLRPSYVLGGRAMEIVTTRPAAPLRHRGGAGFPGNPVLIDGISRRHRGRYRCGVRRRGDASPHQEPIEEAASTPAIACALPPHSLSGRRLADIEARRRAWAGVGAVGS